MKEFVVFVVLLVLAIALHSYGHMNFDVTLFLLFILSVGLLIYRDRKKVKFDKVVFIRRTKKGRDFIDKTAQRHKRFWSVWGTIGVAVASIMLVLGSFFLISQSVSIMEGADGGVRLLLPGPVSQPTNLPGAFVVPWWIWVIGIAFVIIPHEFMHGIMCRIDRIRIKSVGWILLIIIPGAFVEPDEKQLKKARRSVKMRVYAAGSFANIFMAMVVLVVLSLYFTASFAPSGVFVQSINGTPVFEANISGSIIMVDNIPVKSYADLGPALARHKPGDTIEVRVLGGDVLAPHFDIGSADFFAPKPIVVTNSTETSYSVTLAENEGKAYLGVRAYFNSFEYRGDDFQVYQTVATLLLWMYIFSLGIGIVNILPIKPLDGGLLFEEFFAGHKRQRQIVKFVSIAMLAFLLFNLIGPVFA